MLRAGKGVNRGKLALSPLLSKERESKGEVFSPLSRAIEREGAGVSIKSLIPRSLLRGSSLIFPPGRRIGHNNIEIAFLVSLEEGLDVEHNRLQ